MIPAYNEEEQISGLINHLSQIDEFEQIIVVDDGSSDSTFEKGINALADLETDIELVRLEQNTNKVGAIATGVGLAKSKYVMLTDADTRIRDAGNIPEVTEDLENGLVEGYAFQVIPENHESLKTTAWSILQDLDYSVGRVAHFFTTGEKLRMNASKKNVRCVPGAGGIYHRERLLNALQKHSGKHAGDDMEATAIAQFQEEARLSYTDKVRFVSKSPGNYRELLQQRARWNKGALQSFNQQKSNYMREMCSFSRYGMLSIYELLLSFLVPFVFAFVGLSALQRGLSGVISILSTTYLLELLMSGLMTSYSLWKGDVGKANSVLVLPLLPVYRMAVFYPAKILALWQFAVEKANTRIGSATRTKGVGIPQAEIYDARRARRLIRSKRKLEQGSQNEYQRAKEVAYDKPGIY